MAFVFTVDAPPLDAADGPRECFGAVRGPCKPGRGVVPASGMSDFLFAGVLNSGLPFGAASDSGGEGGVGASEAESDFGGGVDAVGEEGVTPLASLPGLLARKLSTASGLGFRDRSLSMVLSASRSFSSVISLSIFKSPNSSRSRCVSIRSASLSCSPFFISSSNSTPRSIAILCLLSMSSKLDSVFLACRS